MQRLRFFTTRRGLITAAVVGAAVLALALWRHAPAPTSLAVAAPTAQGGVQVSIDNFRFGPTSITVPVGTTVTWTNRDDMVHTVTASTRAFSSPGLETGETFSHTFDKPGTYQYFCALHPRMTGTVVVQ